MEGALCKFQLIVYFWNDLVLLVVCFHRIMFALQKIIVKNMMIVSTLEMMLCPVVADCFCLVKTTQLKGILLLKMYEIINIV